MDIRCTWLAGPDAGDATHLSTGRHLVGRSALAAVHCGDPALEPHHVVLDVGRTGVVLTQLAGAAPVWAGGTPVDGPTALRLPACVEVGHSLLVVEAAGPPAPPPMTEPEPEPDGGPGATLLALGAAGLLAAGLREPRFLTFGLAGGAVPLSVLALRRAVVARRSVRPPVRALPLRSVAPVAPALPMQVVVGVEPVDASGTPPRPVRVDLRPGRSLAVSGPLAEAVVRSVVAQLAAQGDRPPVRRERSRTLVGSAGVEPSATLVTTSGPMARLVPDIHDGPLAVRVHVVGRGLRR